MRIWRLTPIGPRRHDWRQSNYIGVAIVRAESEFAARRRAQIIFSRDIARDRGSNAATSPWLDPSRVHCLPLLGSLFTKFGPEEVLKPNALCDSLVA
jgi:hypothetical protein